MFRSGKMRC